MGYSRGQGRLGSCSGRVYTVEKVSRGEAYRMFPQEWLGCLVENSEHSQISLKYFRSEWLLRDGSHSLSSLTDLVLNCFYDKDFSPYIEITPFNMTIISCLFFFCTADKGLAPSFQNPPLGSGKCLPILPF